MVGCLVGGCSLPNPWFGLASEGETTATETGAGPGSTTLLPTSGGPGVSTEEPTGATTEVSGSTGPLTATEALTGTTTGTTEAMATATGVSTSAEETGVPGPDLGALECGDGVPGPGDDCDDGNQAPGDGCEANCKRMFTVSEFAVEEAPSDIAAADLNGDGKVDLVVTHVTPNLGDPDFSLLANEGAGVFGAKALALPGFVGASRVLIGQVVGDGQPDLVFVAAGSGKQLVLANKTMAGVLKLETTQWLQGAPPGPVTDATLAYLDGDDLADLVVVVGEKLFVHLNDGMGGFKPGESYGLELKMASSVAAGPVLKGSAKEHVMVAFLSVTDDGLGFINDGAGKLTPQVDPVKRCPDGASAVRAGDADMLGPIDLVVGCVSGRVTLAGHDGMAAYTRFVEAGAAISGVGTIDLYGGDEAIDVYATTTAGKAVVVGVQVGKKFVATHTEALGSGPTASAVLDYDNDGAPDLAVVLAKANKVGLLRNQTRD